MREICQGNWCGTASWPPTIPDLTPQFWVEGAGEARAVPARQARRRAGGAMVEQC